jgi:small subunit ribosomal protein S11
MVEEIKKQEEVKAEVKSASEEGSELKKDKKEEMVEIKEEKPLKEVKAEVKEEKKEAPKKKERNVEAVVNIYTSFNNTIVHVTDMSGRTLTKVSGGMVTKHNRLKANPTIAMFISKRISETMKDLGVKSLYVRIRAKTGNNSPGPGANALIKSLSREGFKILNILDTTRVPRGGPKKKGGRRGRRV